MLCLLGGGQQVQDDATTLVDDDDKSVDQEREYDPAPEVHASLTTVVVTGLPGQLRRRVIVLDRRQQLFDLLRGEPDLIVDSMVEWRHGGANRRRHLGTPGQLIGEMDE